MSDKTYPYKEAKIVNAKRFYIEFHVWSITDNKLIRKRVGKFKAKTKTARYDEARRMVKEINRLLAQGYVIDKKLDDRKKLQEQIEQVKFYSFVDAIVFAARTKLKGGSDRTVQTYRSFCNMFQLWANINLASQLDITKVDHVNILAFLDWIQTERHINGKTYKAVKNRTYNNYLKHLQILFNVLINRKIVSSNPCYPINSLPVESSKHYPYSPEQITLLESYLKEHNKELWLFTRFIYYAFLRPAELVKLTVNNIDLDNKVILVHASTAKNNKQQSIPINSNLQTIIKESGLLDYPKDFLLFSRKLKPGKKIISPRRAGEKHTEVLKKCGLYDGKLTLYSWKHTGAQNAFRLGGLDIMDLKEMLRHHSLEMTYIYLKSLGVNINKRVNDKKW